MIKNRFYSKIRPSYKKQYPEKFQEFQLENFLENPIKKIRSSNNVGDNEIDFLSN